MTLHDDEEAPASLGEAADFLRLLWELEHALERRSQRAYRALGVTEQQRQVLRLVGRFPGIPAGELSQLMHVHPSTVTDLVQRLESGGWLARRVDPRDRRRALLGLTERGRDLDGARDVPSTEDAVERVLERVPARDFAIARDVLIELVRELDAD